ncbi:MAG: dihydroorotate dehydrogenase-like protein [Elusimicrobia bacterium]|nr:dihydroorotate dehydrogenase-like protein [Elusimicrobiota bacterium]
MDLSTRYLGLELESPLVPSASSATESVDDLKRMEDAGAGAVVLPSLFEEQIRLEERALAHWLQEGSESHPESQTYLPQPETFRLGPDQHLERLRKAKEALSIPVIASLNGTTPGGWTGYAEKLAQAGADALELNIYRVAADPEVPGARVEEEALSVVREVRGRIKVPLAVKVGPYYSSMANMALRLVQAGADGLVLFNRFYQPDVDLEALEVRPKLLLSGPQAQRLPLTWIALLAGRVQGASLAATGGVQTAEDALKMLMVGADAVMMAAELIRRGPGHVRVVLDDMRRWMEEHEYASAAQLKGSMSQRRSADPGAFERANYVRTVSGLHV